MLPLEERACESCRGTRCNLCENTGLLLYKAAAASQRMAEQAIARGFKRGPSILHPYLQLPVVDLGKK